MKGQITDIIQLLIQAVNEKHGEEEPMALSKEELDKRIEAQEYMGIKRRYARGANFVTSLLICSLRKRWSLDGIGGE